MFKENIYPFKNKDIEVKNSKTQNINFFEDSYSQGIYQQRERF